jgi:hypothetical protein
MRSRGWRTVLVLVALTLALCAYARTPTHGSQRVTGAASDVHGTTQPAHTVTACTQSTDLVGTSSLPATTPTVLPRRKRRAVPSSRRAVSGREARRNPERASGNRRVGDGRGENEGRSPEVNET